MKDAYSEYKLDGNYTNFFNKLKTIIIRNYQEAPAALYILSENEYDKNSTIAYSALIDLKKKYPRSPESLLANEKLNHFKRNVAYKKNYLNIKAVSNSFPDISPTIDLSGNERLQKDSEIKYSISIGPFYNLKTAIKLRKMLRKEFKKVFIIKTNKEFTLNVGEITNIREANNFQIRISEEYGLKGKIINLQSNKNKVYLYN